MKLKKLLTVLISLFVILALSGEFTAAYAINSDYLDAEKWKESKNVKFTQINKTAIDNYTLNGRFGYFSDNQSMSLYTYFDIDESTVSDDNKDFRTEYRIRTQYETYSIAIKNDGTIDGGTDKDGKQVFDGYSRFYNDRNTFISAIQYREKETWFISDVSLWVNGHKYLIKEGIKTDLNAGLTTTSTTAKSKAEKKKSKKKKSKKDKKETTTKFTPKGYVTTNGSKNGKTSGAAGKYEANNTTAPTTKGKKKSKKSSKKSSSLTVDGEGQTVDLLDGTHMNRHAFILLIIAIILCTAGVTLVITAAVIKSNKKKNDEEPTEEIEE